jgi:excisionase family DNA binding protein
MSKRAAVNTEVRVLEQPERPFYTTRSLAQRLAVNERTVRRLLNSGEIPSYYIGTARRIDPDDVDSYLERMRDDRRVA